MEKNKNERDPTTLIIRHLPEQMSREERIEFCKYYGAQKVAVMSDRGKMKYCAFAYFPDGMSSTKALHKLHQMTIYGRTLTVEYARKNASLRHDLDVDSSAISGRQPMKDSSNAENISNVMAKARREEQTFMEGPVNLSTLSKKLGMKYPMNPTLRYSYPRPTQQIIMNIANALASVPQFYTQVLHLMNKMNLPAPFTLASFPAPPLPQEEEMQLPPEPEEMEISSEEESELESEEEDKDQNKTKDVLPVKRPSKRRPTKLKRPRIDQLLAASKATANAPSAQSMDPSKVFEEPRVTWEKTEIRLSEGIAAALSMQADAVTGPSEDVTGGFGTFTPAAPPTDKRDEEEDNSDDEIESTEFIRREELKNKINKDDMKRMSVYKGYNPGEPNTRLYIKNLSKQVEEKDLKFIYGRYVDWTSSLDKDMFSIQLMKQGRMKGQAFVGLPSEFAAKKALKETNGYLLHGKPLVVVYARSAKPKPDQDDKKGKKS